MGQRTEEVARRLAERGPETVTFFRALSPEQWRQQVYTTGPEWDVRQVLCHFVSVERHYRRIFDAALHGDSPPDSFDIDAFNAEQVASMARLSPADLLSQFEALRAASIAFVRTLSDADLDRQSWHPFFGWDKLEKYVRLLYRHNMIHERDIRRALETGVPVPPTEHSLE